MLLIVLLIPFARTKNTPLWACYDQVLQWWGRLDLNQRPTGYEPAALTTELRPQIYLSHYTVLLAYMLLVVEFTKAPDAFAGSSGAPINAFWFILLWSISTLSGGLRWVSGSCCFFHFVADTHTL